jgi:hypothetical protein
MKVKDQKQIEFLQAANDVFFFLHPGSQSAPDEFIRGQAPACIAGTGTLNKPFRAAQHFPSPGANGLGCVCLVLWCNWS